MIQSKKERGWILRILDRLYPEGLDADSLKKQLIELRFIASENDIRANLAYLQDKGLIKSEEVGAGCIKRTVISLTTDGKDIVDGVISPIPGVDI